MADPQTARWLAADGHADLMRALAAYAMLAGCSASAPNAATSDTDPAITDALADPILADPRLALQDRGGAIGVPVGIDGGDHGRTLGQIATATVKLPAFAGCDARIDYAFAWMARLPADLGLPETAQVSEAAGSNTRRCQLRVVRYDIARPVADVNAFYRKTGFALTIDSGTVSGVRATDGAAFWVSVSRSTTGATVDFVTNHGR